MEVLEILVQEIWEKTIEATHERFGWAAAAIVALASVVMIVLVIGLIVVWAFG